MDRDPPTSRSPKPVAAKAAANGTLLEAAFVDPAYTWPPPEGQGRNAIELQASLNLTHNLDDDDDASFVTTASMKERMRLPPKPHDYLQYTWWKCCGRSASVDSIAFRAYEQRCAEAKRARQEHAALRKARDRLRTQNRRKEQRYSTVPEGILVYRLDTSRRLLQLMSQPHERTDRNTLVTEMTIVRAAPSNDKSRRGLVLTGEDGTIVTLIACEQRTATAWLEAMSLMSAKAKWSVLRKGGVSHERGETLGSLGYQSHGCLTRCSFASVRPFGASGTRKSSMINSSRRLKTRT